MNVRAYLTNSGMSRQHEYARSSERLIETSCHKPAVDGRFRNFEHNAVPVYEFDRTFIEEVAGLLERRSELSISITEREVYLEISGSTFTTTIAEYRAR